MKKLTAAWAGALAVITPETFLSNVAHAWIAHNNNNNNALISGDNDGSFPSAPLSMLEVQLGETYKFVKPEKIKNGLEFRFETILGTLFHIKSNHHHHCAAGEVSFNLQQSTEYGKKTNIQNIDDCQQECHSDAKCAGALYYPEDLLCRFFSKISGVQKDLHAGIVLPTCNGSCFHDKYTLVGSKVSLGFTPNALICQAFCRGDPACYGFSWNKKTGECYRFGDKVALAANNDYISGSRDICSGNLSRLEAGNPLYSNSASVGDHFSLHRWTANAERCRLNCLNDRRCVSFDYNTKNRNCYLKQHRGARITSSGVQTGSRLSDVSCHKKNYIFTGSYFKSMRDVNHPSECHSECLANNSCTKWSFYPAKKICDLFGDVTTGLKLAHGAYYGSKEPCRNDAAYQYGDNYPCVLKGIKLGSAPFESVGAGDLPSCQSKCNSNNNCEMYAFDLGARKCHFHLAVAVQTQTNNDKYFSGPRTCGNCYSNDKYFSGEQAGEVDNVQSAEECQLYCQATGYCAYWSFTTDSKECTFYKDGAVAKAGKNNITGPKYCDGGCDLRGVQASTPDFGFFQNLGKKSLQECRNACRNNKDCLTFTHQPNTTCTLSDATNLRNLSSINNMSYVYAFKNCASCVQEGVGYKPEKEALLWSITTHSGQECKERCELMEFCTFFSFNVKTRQCFLLSGKTQEEKGEHWVSGPSQCEARDSCFLKDTGLTDYDNIITTRLPTVEACQERCKEDVACRFFAFDGAKKLCTLKSAGVYWKDKLRLQARKGFITGTKKCLVDIDDKSVCECHDYSFFGSNLDTKPAAAKDVKECRRMCLKEPRCRFWVYNKKQKNCNIKGLRGSSLQGAFVPDKNIFAGSRLGCPRCLRSGIAYGGTKIMIVALQTEAMCQQGCEAIEPCEVFTFVKEICTFYRNHTGPHAASSNTISGPKRC